MKEKEGAARSVKPFGNESAANDSEDKNWSGLKVNSRATVQKDGKPIKYKYCNNQNPSSKILGNSSVNGLPDQSMGANFAISSASDYPLPVLGLCAPNACQPELSHRITSRAIENRQGKQLDLPSSISACPRSFTKEVMGVETTMGKTKLPEASSECAPQHLKSCLPDNSLPLPLVLSLSFFPLHHPLTTPLLLQLLC